MDPCLMTCPDCGGFGGDHRGPCATCADHTTVLRCIDCAGMGATDGESCERCGGSGVEPEPDPNDYL